MDVKLLLVLLFAIISCTPQGDVSKGSSVSPTSTGGSTGGSSTSTSLTTIWNFLGTNANLISVNVTNIQTAYLVGAPVEKFLDTTVDGIFTNFAGAEYCLISNFTISGTATQLRTRVVPISYFDFKANKTVRVFRVDFPDVTNSQGLCNLPVRTFSATGALVVEPFATPKFDPNLLCSTCTSFLTSGKLRLFKRGTTLDEVSLNLVTLTPLTLKVDPNANSTGEVGICSNSECVSRGFDCCLDNQCVRDGFPRPSASLSHTTQLAMAEAERLQNPLAYLNYPHLFYVCGNSIPTTTTTGPTTGVTYDAAFEALKNDYNCIQDLKNLSSSTPFHSDTLLAPGLHPFNASTKCLTSAAQTSSTMFYQSVMRRLYQTCGCAQTNLPDMVSSCPAYDYVIEEASTTGAPLRIDCFTPAVVEPSIPSTQNVNVSARSAPHRFFDSSGNEQVLSLNANFTQEGEVFNYADDQKLIPQAQNFSMNSILGQMSVTMDKALPAKTVDVEVDQVYLISTRQGFYTPCPTCSKDSWLSTLTAFPTSSFGTGLQAIGHSTARDELSTNITGGNYEDTIFGRACWLPPTMIPFTHTSNSTIATQRTDRLRAQAALFINGYQKDWFGFNKGATIGSFDGVTWFAIGKGRIVRSTSKKLFLAINAPFADVASPTLQVVNISAFDGISQATAVDYDPQFHLSHPLQNEAGNCQANHFCSTDTDCVTKLGWEYSCADVKTVKTKWPTFDADGNEKTGSTILTLDQILAQKKFPSASSKRCIYRGAGALCNRATEAQLNLMDVNEKRFATCAPNFFCADVDNTAATNSVFNSKISRFAGPIEDIPVVRNHLYGRDTNVLGRPLHYVATSSSTAALETTTLPSNIFNILKDNSALTLIPPEVTNAETGVCRPGKALNANSPFTQHRSADTESRTDFINQIASCDSKNFKNATAAIVGRFASCPVINATSGNYTMFTSTLPLTSSGLEHAQAARHQNSCGLEVVSGMSSATMTSSSTTADQISIFSPFKLIEAKPLSNTSQTIIDPTLTRDACLRRAGQVCHTDLDCGPNKFHAAQVDFFPSFFGNDAEKAYYSEYLVCGQETPKPLPSQGTVFTSFNMGLNRCCREAGKDISTFTSDIPTSNVTSLSGGVHSVPYEASSQLLMSLAVTDTPQNSAFKNSRLMTVENLGTPDRPYLTAFQNWTNAAAQTLVATNVKSLGVGSTFLNVNVRTPKQWRTLNEANSETCCGGGWVRKFADGTNNWSKRDRLFMDVTNFKCLNSRTTLLTNPTFFDDYYRLPFTKTTNAVLPLRTYVPASNNATNTVAKDFLHYCIDPLGEVASCAQFGFESNVADTPPDSNPSFTYEGSIQVNTLTPNFVDKLDYLFKPFSADTDVRTHLNFTTTDARKNIKIKIPSYISSEFEERLNEDELAGVHNTIKLVNADESFFTECSPNSLAFPFETTLTSPTTGDTVTCIPINGNCCYAYDQATRTIIATAQAGSIGGAVPDDEDLGLTFEFHAVGSVDLRNFLSPKPGYQALTKTRTKPGTDSYYLRRLGNFELLGIPQISYEALYCNDDEDRVVPGLFKTSLPDRASFEANTNSFKDNGIHFVNQFATDHEPIFSANDFKCCSPLGKTVNSQATCCSGFGVSNNATNTSFTCRLPAGTDLMVYFNRFVSNEGVGTDKPGGGLVEADFEDQTGEPKVLNASVIQKISAMGNAFCVNNSVRQGGAFGQFAPEPVGPFTRSAIPIYNIVDSFGDFATNSNATKTVDVGYFAFMNGFRWNHHLYCDD